MQTLEWLHAFKLGVIEKDIAKMMRLHKKMPEFTILEEMKMAQALIVQARDIFIEERSRLQKSMGQLKKSIEFQRNSIRNSHTKFDSRF